MDIFEYALQMEKDGENFYRRIAEATHVAGVRTIVTMLADEEVRHYKAIERMRQGRSGQMAETALLDDAKNIFVQMKDQHDEFTAEQEQVELYQKAQQIEKRSQKFYEEKSAQVDRKDQRLLFEQLAGEEAKHFFLLGNLIDFVSRPEQWLENAEWYHLEEY
jgi:rubrerythrin